MRTERISVNYDRDVYSWYERYIHKYYLPTALKRRINPTDIGAIEKFRGTSEGIPDPIPPLTVHYKDIDAMKQLTPEEVTGTLDAIDAYWKDIQADITPEVAQAAMELNRRLIELEWDVLVEYARVDAKMRKRMREGDRFLNDYEIEVRFDFYLREDDTFFDNDEENKFDADRDASLVCTVQQHGRISMKKAASPDYWGIGDMQDHNDTRGCERFALLSVERHCSLFHEMYDHRHVPFCHMGRIGKVWTDIQVWLQNERSVL